jgi:hypothetical protein
MENLISIKNQKLQVFCRVVKQNKLKKSFILFIFFFISFFSYGQSVNDIYNDLDKNRAIISISGNWLVFTKFFDVPGKTKKWLYNKLANEVTKGNTKPPTLEWNEDRDVAIISENFELKRKSMRFGGLYWCSFNRLTFEIKEGKVRMTVSVIQISNGVDNVRVDYNPSKFYPNKEKKGEGLKELYYVYQNFIGSVKSYEDILTDKADSDW